MAFINVEGVPVVPLGINTEEFTIKEAKKYYKLVSREYESLVLENLDKFEGCDIEKIEVDKDHSKDEKAMVDYFVAARNKRGETKKCFILRLGENRVLIDGVTVQADPTIFSEDELKNYVDYVKGKVKPATLNKIRVTLDKDGKVEVDWVTYDRFERIRRITGE